jgi:nitrate reductase delta subunit
MDFLPEAEKELRNEALLSTDRLEEVAQFINHFRKIELTDWQAEYVQLFDYSRSASLHLFEHVKSDSKDRGQAMVDMHGFYQENGLQLSANELPDYLPVFLEFLSSRTIDKAAELLAEPVHIIARIHAALEEKKNMYRHILSSVISLSAKQPDAKVTEAIIKNEKPLNLDAEYEEKPVEFGSGETCMNCK